MDFQIAGSGGELLKVTVTGYTHPDTVDYWDGNWLSCHLNLWLNGFRADFPFDLRIDEMERFLKQLEQLHTSLKGNAALDSMEGILKLNVSGGKTGRLAWEGKLVYPSGTGAVLEFEYESDQTYLSRLIQELKAILKRYPVRGRFDV